MFPLDQNQEPPDPAPRDGPSVPPSSDDAMVAWLLQELRTLARTQLAGERAGHTLNPTALVNEAYLKLCAGQSDPLLASSKLVSDRARFFGFAARAMRQVLVDHARSRGRLKRGGGRSPVSADLDLSATDPPPDPPIDPAEIAAVLDRLETLHPDAARVVELRFFAGISEAVIADLMGISERTVRRHWTFAKAWLHRELTRLESSDS